MGGPCAVAARVQHARVAMRALAPEGAVRALAVEADPVPFEVADTAGRALDEDARHRFVDQPRPRRDGVGQVLLGRVVGTDGGRDSALRMACASFVQVCLGQEEQGAERARLKRGEEPRHAAADHDRPVLTVRLWGNAHGT